MVTHIGVPSHQTKRERAIESTERINGQPPVTGISDDWKPIHDQMRNRLIAGVLNDGGLDIHNLTSRQKSNEMKTREVMRSELTRVFGYSGM